MTLPKLTPLQYLVVSLLFSGEKSTRQLRDALAALEIRARESAFHRVLQRMRLSLVVNVRRQELRVAGRAGSEYYYQVTDHGLALWQAARQFYLGCPEPPPDLQPVAAGYVTDEEFRCKLNEAFQRIAEQHLSARRAGPRSKKPRGGGS